MNIYPVILCGGSGTRLWPMSRGGYPKQYLKLTGDHTLLQQTVLRLEGIAGIQPPIVITNADQRFLVAEQLRHIHVQPAAVVLEPVGRNTAPAVAVAALLAAKNDPEALILVLPSDHVIQNEGIFQQLVSNAAVIAHDQHLVTFGITPTEPHTGYGYIRRAATLAATPGAYRVAAFIEKPAKAVAEGFLNEGGYYWNSGMFMLPAQGYLDELATLQPEILHFSQEAVDKAVRDLDFIRLDAEAFAQCPNDSIDYAVMEKTSKAAVIEAAELGWNDIGSWTALAEMAAVDEQGNTLLGDVMVEQASNCYIRAEQRMVAAIGVDNLVIVETPDAILVATRERAQDVKTIVSRLNAEGRSESVTHRKVARPWGSYEGLDLGERFQVKRIVVNPGSSLSLQMHHHRAEHWIVVQGTAKVWNGDKVILLTENQSTYIPLGVTHRLENPGKIALELIEVQSGSYLGEDDIVRFEDVYGRTQAK